MDVDAYLNIRTGLVSVRARSGPEDGRVIHRAEAVTIADPEFVVQPGGNKRVRESGVKNVHAFVRGTFDTAIPPQDLTGELCVVYNPKYNTSFVCSETGRPVVSGQLATVTKNGVYTLEPELK